MSDAIFVVVVIILIILLIQTYEVSKMPDALADLTAAVSAVTQAATDATTTLKSVADRLLAALNNPGPNGIDPTAVEQAAVSLQVVASNIEAAVSAANTEVPAPTTSTPIVGTGSSSTPAPTTPTP